MKQTPFFAAFAIAMASLACSVFVGGPDIPDPVPVAPGDPLQALEGQIQQAVKDSLSTGVLSLQLSQEQLTAYVVSKLANREPPLLTDTRVVLADQKMILYGRANSGMVEANVAVTTEFGIDSAGLPEIRITDAQLGPLPMPQALQDAITAAMDEALTGAIGPAAIGFRLESIDISGGVMTLTGRVR
jgi:hypothetical protein